MKLSFLHLSVVSLIFAWIGLHDCVGDESPKLETKNTNMNDTIHKAVTSIGAVSLQAELHVQPKVLEIQYTVINGQKSDIYLFNRLIKTAADGSGKVDPNLTYVWFDPGPTAHIGKSLQQVPAHLQVAQREIPYLTRVSPGQQFKETITVELPMAEHHPYRSLRETDRLEPKQTSVRSMRLEVGFLVHHDGLSFLEFAENDEQLFAFQTPFEALDEQEILRIDTDQLSFPALIPVRPEPILNTSDAP